MQMIAIQETISKHYIVKDMIMYLEDSFQRE